ncbi:MAG: DUF3300 domain-containing protein [Propionivibrio sp.]
MSTHRSSLAAGSKQFLGVLLIAVHVFFSSVALAQAPAASGDAAPALTTAELDRLVGPIALYPDDLIAIILPSATYPLEIVQADRYLDKKKIEKDLPVNEAWQDSVKSLLNYPDVVKKMSLELDWTSDLGEAVVADQGAVLEAIQRFRRQVQAAGNLKSDDKQTVIVEKEVIQVVQANPEVIYVPQYDPTTVVVAGGYPTYAYYPSPYPVYYYPYPPGAAFATGLIWGAAIGAAWSGGRWGCNYGGEANISINRNTNINTSNFNSANINRGSRQSAEGTAWRSDKKPGQVSGQTGRRTGNARVGDTAANLRGGSDFGGGARQSAQQASRPSAGLNDRASSSRQFSDRNSPSRGGEAFGSYGSGRDARADSSRGASSRQSMPSSSRGQSFQGGGGGGRSSIGGGGRSGGGRIPAGGGRGGRR